MEHVKNDTAIPEDYQKIGLASPFELFKELIADCNTEADNPVLIAGGAIRDSLHHLPYRDIDLYCRVNDYGTLFKYLNSEADRVSGFTYSKSSEYMHQSIAAQIEFTHEDYGIINLIGLHDDAMTGGMVEVVDRFNIGFNQMAYDGNQAYVAPAAAQDYRDKTLTVLREDWGVEGTEKNIIKLLAKYPAHRAIFKDGEPYSRAAADLRASGQFRLNFDHKQPVNG